MLCDQPGWSGTGLPEFLLQPVNRHGYCFSTLYHMHIIGRVGGDSPGGLPNALQNNKFYIAALRVFIPSCALLCSGKERS